MQLMMDILHKKLLVRKGIAFYKEDTYCNNTHYPTVYKGVKRKNICHKNPEIKFPNIAPTLITVWKIPKGVPLCWKDKSETNTR